MRPVAMNLERSERRGLFFVIPVSSPVATFEQSENVTIAHLVGARAAACSCLQLLAVRGVASLGMRTVLMGNLTVHRPYYNNNYVQSPNSQIDSASR